MIVCLGFFHFHPLTGIVGTLLEETLIPECFLPNLSLNWDTFPLCSEEFCSVYSLISQYDFPFTGSQQIPTLQIKFYPCRTAGLPSPDAEPSSLPILNSTDTWLGGKTCVMSPSTAHLQECVRPLNNKSNLIGYSVGSNECNLCYSFERSTFNLCWLNNWEKHYVTAP